MINVLLTIAVFPQLVFAIAEEWPCAERGDVFNGPVCYEFVENNEISSYEQAANYCNKKAKHLANIRSQYQMDFVVSEMANRGWQQAFIGLRFIRTGWKWVGNKRLLRGQGCSDSVYSDNGEYSSFISNTMTNEGCINFCSMQRLPFAALQQGQFCYCSSSYIWPQAASNCSLPCSGASNQRCGGYFTNVVFFAADGAYDNWKFGRPNANGICAAVEMDREFNQWVDVSCTLRLPFICKTRFISEKLNDSDVVACGIDACYYLYSEKREIWLDADRFCISRGSRLASIETQKRQDIVDKLLFGSTLSKQTLVWIGAVNYQWFQPGQNTSQFSSELTFDGWIQPNEPVAPETYPCAAAVSVFNLYGLKSAKCDDLSENDFRFICTSRSFLPEPDYDTGSTTISNYEYFNNDDATTVTGSTEETTLNVENTTTAWDITTIKSGVENPDIVTQQPDLSSSIAPVKGGEPDVGRGIQWWAILLIVVGAILLIVFVIVIIIVVVKIRKGNQVETSEPVNNNKGVAKTVDEENGQTSSHEMATGTSDDV